MSRYKQKPTNKGKQIVLAAVIGTALTATFLASSSAPDDDDVQEIAAPIKMQTAKVELYYGTDKNGEEQSFKFSFQEPAEGEAPIKKYRIGEYGLDKFWINFEHAFGVSVEDSFKADLLSKNPKLLQKIAEQAIKAGFYKETGQTALPNVLSLNQNNKDTSPGQQVTWEIDIDGDGERDFLQMESVYTAAPRTEEKVTHFINLEYKTYCQENTVDFHSKKEYFPDKFYREFTSKTCVNLGDMTGTARTQLFEQFNAQKLFGTSNYSNHKSPVLSENTNRTYSLAWKSAP